MPEQVIQVYECKRCGHRWSSKIQEGRKPVQCPRCHSPLWDRERVVRNGGKK